MSFYYELSKENVNQVIKKLWSVFLPVLPVTFWPKSFILIPVKCILPNTPPNFNVVYISSQSSKHHQWLKYPLKKGYRKSSSVLYLLTSRQHPISFADLNNSSKYLSLHWFTSYPVWNHHNLVNYMWEDNAL